MDAGNHRDRRDHPGPERRPDQAARHLCRVHDVRPSGRALDGDRGQGWKEDQAEADGLDARRLVPPAAFHPAADLPRGQLRRAGSHRCESPWQARSLQLFRSGIRPGETLRTRQDLRSQRCEKARAGPEPDGRSRLQRAELRGAARLFRIRPLRRHARRHRRWHASRPACGHQRAHADFAADPRADPAHAEPGETARIAHSRSVGTGARCR